MSNFDDRPFVAGSLTGLRAFKVDRLGRLQGPHRGGVFKPGENQATCQKSPWDEMNQSFTAALNRLSISMGSLSYGGHPVRYSLGMPETPEVEESTEPTVHTVGSTGCSCGYYAYFDGSNESAASDTVSALIEGYGVCTVGSRGFRASKARLIALILPRQWKPTAKWLLGHPLVLLALAAINFVLLGIHMQDEMTVVQGVSLVGGILSLGAASALSASRSIDGDPIFPKRPKPAVDRSLLRRNYADVPVYRSQRRALAKHPLTPPPGPPEPTPDDEDFWTRPAATR